MGSTGIAVSVANGYHLDTRLYVLRGSARILLGRVEAFGRRTFVVDGARLGGGGTLVLLVDPAGSGPPVTLPAVGVVYGQRVEVRLAHDLGYSSISVS